MGSGRRLSEQTIVLQRAAPAKPAWGAPCNGCGVCCAAEPCPLGQLRYRQRRGACPALRWNAEAQRYYCGLLAAAAQGRCSRLQQWWLRRLIGAGRGCDSDAELLDA